MYSKSINVIGIMSGTSLDGLDLCLVSFDSNNYSNFKILNSQTYNYSSDWVNKLSNAINLREKDLNILDDEFGKLISNYINKFLIKIGSPKVDLVSSHGHTVFHDPEKGITKQIGNGEIIFNKTNINLICDFRTQDVELGGQGAPLVPIGDLNLFENYKYCLCCSIIKSGALGLQTKAPDAPTIPTLILFFIDILDFLENRSLID